MAGSFLGGIVSAVTNPIGTGAAVATRDAGHAINLASNEINYGQAHAPVGAKQAFGSKLVDYSHNNLGNVPTFYNTSGVGQVPSPTKAQVNTSPTTQPTNNGNQQPRGYVLGASTGGSAGPSTAQVDQINQTYDPLINTYQSYLNSVPTWQGRDTGLAKQSYQDQANTYQHQFDAGNANLDQQQKVLNDSYQRSLQQLGNNVRNQFQGQLNQLGVGGAGDSSAAQMSAYALANEQNMNRGYMNTDLNNQLTQIGLQRHNLGQSFNDEMAQLSTAREQALNDIAKQYYQLKQQILNDMQSTETSKKNAMMWTNNWAANQVAGVDNSINQKVADLNSKYTNPASTLDKGLSFTPNYQATTITSPTVAAQQGTSQQVDPNSVLLAPGSNNDQNQMPLAAVLNNQNQYNTSY